MNTTLRIGAAALLLAALGLQGCATGSNSNSAYTSYQAQREQTVRFCTVESVRNVVIDREQTGVGTLAGGAVGGIGSAAAIGRGNGSVAAGILGAIAGGIAGSAIEGQVNKRPGLEITVKLDNGEYRAITQEADEAFRPGERVRLLSSGGVTRVTH
ncbi:hypothetical protein [Ralstonia pseudosolanacearum]|uniref:outer membrane lipoprotein n=1 Tax=Ralstonia pseudosolanacearum TaxID=1310165 RepID=UPI001FF774CD|nr:hypothetical protein [Ralstonia pseudosolanacearum]